MSDSLTLAAERLFTLRADTEAALPVSGLPCGDRIVIDVVGGSFEGPKLRGRVRPSGGDWLLLSSGGARLDVRLVLEAEDGTPILLRYAGVATSKGGGQRADVAGFLDAPTESPHAWLNGVHVLGFGRAEGGAAVYDFFHLL
jgi:hypothetical protein